MGGWKGYLGTRRYLKLLQRGAHEAKLDDDYTKWLDAMDCVPSNERGQEYYTAPDGTRVKVSAAWAMLYVLSISSQGKQGCSCGVSARPASMQREVLLLLKREQAL